MTIRHRSLAWHLGCRMYALGCPIKEASLSPNERIGLKFLQGTMVELAPVRLDCVMCPYCQQEDGLVTLEDGRMVCHCADCGAVELDGEDKRSWQLKPDWLARKIRAALNLDGSQQQVELAPGIVRLGLYERHPIVIAPRLITLQTCPDLIERVSVGRCAEPWFFTPLSLKCRDRHVLGRAAYWWPLEERFVLFASGLSFIPPGAVIDDLGSEPPGPTHGPFSADFRWVFLEDALDDPVELSPAQAAIFKVLWFFQGKPQTAEVIMTKAGLESLKPVDIFKVKTSNKGDPRYERPKLAYDTLVHTRRREGRYSLPCAGHATKTVR